MKCSGNQRATACCKYYIVIKGKICDVAPAMCVFKLSLISKLARFTNPLQSRTVSRKERPRVREEQASLSMLDSKII